MGRSLTPAYRIEITEVTLNANTQTSTRNRNRFAWHVRARFGARGYGLPTAANLADWVAAYEAGTQPGGVNHQPGKITLITHAQLVRQAGGQVVATYHPAPFQVI